MGSQGVPVEMCCLDGLLVVMFPDFNWWLTPRAAAQASGFLKLLAHDRGSVSHCSRLGGIYMGVRRAVGDGDQPIRGALCSSSATASSPARILLKENVSTVKLECDSCFLTTAVSPLPQRSSYRPSSRSRARRRRRRRSTRLGN